MTEIRSEMTVNYNFDLEDDDFFADNFFSGISEKDLLTSTAVNQKPATVPTENTNKKDINQQQTATTSHFFNCTIEDARKDDCKKTNNILSPVPTDILTKVQDKQLSVLSPLPDLNSKDSLHVNSRFIPGFTPKAKKRKFPGPAGVYSQQNKLQVLSCDLEKTSSKEVGEEVETADIPSSQFTDEDLQLPSWQNLQKDVSSCQSLLSTAKYHSIQRVLNETSKKKLPKHVVVPVLCVFIKKFKPEDSSLLLIDDTGEISGKIYKDTLDEYKEHIKVGTALILKKVTSLCNVLLLKKPCMASIYLEDGSVRHIHELNSILDKDGPLKQMSCECPGTPKAGENAIDTILKMCDASLTKAATSSRPSLPKNAAGCGESSVNKNTPNLPKQRNVDSNGRNNLSSCMSPNIQQFSNVSGGVVSKANSSGLVPLARQSISKGLVPYPTNTENQFNDSGIRPMVSGSSVPVNSSKVETLPTPKKNSGESEDLFCDGLEMDEFDELLCSLDEKSFLGEI